MAFSMLSRREFCAASAAALLLAKPVFSGQMSTLYRSSRPDVAVIDHDRILAAADRALTGKVVTLPSLPAVKSAGGPQDFYSESDAVPTAFTAHRDAVLALSRDVAALGAAFQLTHKEGYAAQARLDLNTWFVDSATRMNPSLAFAGMAMDAKKELRPSFEGVLDTVFFAEIAQAIPVLASSAVFSAGEIAAIKGWFAEYLTWLGESRLAGLARDQKDHHGSSWLLQSAAYARLTDNEKLLNELRHRYKTVTLRAEIVADGTFPKELESAWPYRNSLFNLELLAAACELLSSRFENLWEYELQDGPGLHIAMARHFPYMKDRGSWPYRADITHFTDLPVRYTSLLLAARAYSRPEYAELWQTLNPDPVIPEIVRAFPISQPLLWVGRLRA
ncbi:MAG: alginate lyase family protein [Granulicella sp.]